MFIINTIISLYIYIYIYIYFASLSIIIINYYLGLNKQAAKQSASLRMVKILTRVFNNCRGNTSITK